jgi:hypothetical protein
MFLTPQDLMPPPVPINFADPKPTVHITEDLSTQGRETASRVMNNRGPLSPVMEHDRLSDVISEDLGSVPEDLASVISEDVKTLSLRGGKKGGAKGGKKSNKKVLVI